MDDVTEHITREAAKPRDPSGAKESRFANISIRGWLALLTTATVCTMVLAQIEPDPNFLAQWGMVLAFYFAQREKPQVKEAA